MKRKLKGVWPTALHLAQEHGLAVFPLRPGHKIPFAGSHGCLDASTHPEQIGERADRFPRANYGIACGGWRRLLVIDFDRLAALAAFTERYGMRPPTPTVATPKPGRHEYFTLPAGATLGNTASKLFAGVDTRVHHGYVVGPGSTLADGRGYTTLPGLGFNDVDIAPLPESILAALMPRPITKTTTSSPAPSPAPSGDVTSSPTVTGDNTKRITDYLRALPSLADGQGRNAAAYRLAAYLIHTCGESPADAMKGVLIWNRRNIDKLSEEKLQVIVKNAAQFGGPFWAAA